MRRRRWALTAAMYLPLGLLYTGALALFVFSDRKLPAILLTALACGGALDRLVYALAAGLDRFGRLGRYARSIVAMQCLILTSMGVVVALLSIFGPPSRYPGQTAFVRDPLFWGFLAAIGVPGGWYRARQTMREEPHRWQRGRERLKLPQWRP